MLTVFRITVSERESAQEKALFQSSQVIYRIASHFGANLHWHQRQWHFLFVYLFLKYYWKFVSGFLPQNFERNIEHQILCALYAPEKVRNLNPISAGFEQNFWEICMHCMDVFQTLNNVLYRMMYCMIELNGKKQRWVVFSFLLSVVRFQFQNWKISWKKKTV